MFQVRGLKHKFDTFYIYLIDRKLGTEPLNGLNSASVETNTKPLTIFLSLSTVMIIYTKL